MIAKVFSAALIGLDAKVVEVEVDIRRGKNQINIVGLPDKAVSEAKERLIPALRNSACVFPKGTITVNLAPANMPKTGSIYDLPIAAGILLASEQIKFDYKRKIFIGELSLEGVLRESKGILSIVDSLFKKDYCEFFVPEANINEACLVEDATCFGIKKIDEIIAHFKGNRIEKGVLNIKKPEQLEDLKYDMQFIKGQEHAKRAITIAASGGHNCLFVGVPGSGKTYLSRCLPGILPDMDFTESMEVTRIYSVAGLVPQDKPLITTRPFRAPHHTSSQIALVGGGSIPKPGEVTLAHRGVLFLDEFSEFSSQSLEALRQPLEDKIVNISRASGTLMFPANFMLVAAMNPCKCGFRGDPDRECICSVNEYLKYQKKISGPILDRIDLQVKVPKVNFRKLTTPSQSNKSSEVKKLIEKARDIQKERFNKHKDISTNNDMTQQLIKRDICLNKNSLELLKTAIDSFNLSARSYFKILKVARTIADIEESETVRKEHIAEALSYRL